MAAAAAETPPPAQGLPPWKAQGLEVSSPSDAEDGPYPPYSAPQEPEAPYSGNAPSCEALGDLRPPLRPAPGHGVFPSKGHLPFQQGLAPLQRRHAPVGVAGEHIPLPGAATKHLGLHLVMPLSQAPELGPGQGMDMDTGGGSALVSRKRRLANSVTFSGCLGGGAGASSQAPSHHMQKSNTLPSWPAQGAGKGSMGLPLAGMPLPSQVPVHQPMPHPGVLPGKPAQGFNPVAFASEIKALEGTPLGRLLQATPDIVVDGIPRRIVKPGGTAVQAGVTRTAAAGGGFNSQQGGGFNSQAGGEFLPHASQEGVPRAAPAPVIQGPFAPPPNLGPLAYKSNTHSPVAYGGHCSLPSVAPGAGVRVPPPAYGLQRPSSATPLGYTGQRVLMETPGAPMQAIGQGTGPAPAQQGLHVWSSRETHDTGVLGRTPSNESPPGAVWARTEPLQAQGSCTTGMPALFDAPLPQPQPQPGQWSTVPLHAQESRTGSGLVPAGRVLGGVLSPSPVPLVHHHMAASEALAARQHLQALSVTEAGAPTATGANGAGLTHCLSQGLSQGPAHWRLVPMPPNTPSQAHQAPAPSLPSFPGHATLQSLAPLMAKDSMDLAAAAGPGSAFKAVRPSTGGAPQIAGPGSRLLQLPALQGSPGNGLRAPHGLACLEYTAGGGGLANLDQRAEAGAGVLPLLVESPNMAMQLRHHSLPVLPSNEGLFLAPAPPRLVDSPPKGEDPGGDVAMETDVDGPGVNFLGRASSLQVFNFFPCLGRSGHGEKGADGRVPAEAASPVLGLGLELELELEAPQHCDTCADGGGDAMEIQPVGFLPSGKLETRALFPAPLDQQQEPRPDAKGAQTLRCRDPSGPWHVRKLVFGEGGGMSWQPEEVAAEEMVPEGPPVQGLPATGDDVDLALGLNLMARSLSVSSTSSATNPNPQKCAPAPGSPASSPGAAVAGGESEVRGSQRKGAGQCAVVVPQPLRLAGSRVLFHAVQESTPVGVQESPVSLEDAHQLFQECEHWPEVIIFTREDGQVAWVNRACSEVALVAAGGAAQRRHHSWMDSLGAALAPPLAVVGCVGIPASRPVLLSASIQISPAKQGWEQAEAKETFLNVKGRRVDSPLHAPLGYLWMGGKQ